MFILYNHNIRKLFMFANKPGRLLVAVLDRRRKISWSSPNDLLPKSALDGSVTRATSGQICKKWNWLCSFTWQNVETDLTAADKTVALLPYLLYPVLHDSPNGKESSRLLKYSANSCQTHVQPFFAAALKDPKRRTSFRFGAVWASFYTNLPDQWLEACTVGESQCWTK